MAKRSNDEAPIPTIEVEGLADDIESTTQDGRIVREGGGFQRRQTVDLPLEQIEGINATLQGDPKAMENYSTSPVEPLPPRPTEMNNKLIAAAQAQAALNNPRTREKLDPTQAATLKHMQDVMSDMPGPDITTYIDNRRMTLPSSVIDAPNRLDRQRSLKLVEALAGEQCVGDKRFAGGKVEPCVCLTHKVARAAQQWGFRDKPGVWLSQHMAVETRKRDRWKEIKVERFNFDPLQDADINSPGPKAAAMLFGRETAEDVMFMAELNNVSTVTIIRELITRICDTSVALKTPLDYTGQFDV